MNLQRPNSPLPEPRRSALRAALLEEVRATIPGHDVVETAEAERLGSSRTAALQRPWTQRRRLTCVGLGVATCVVAASAAWALQADFGSQAGPPAIAQSATPTVPVATTAVAPTPLTAVTPQVLAAALQPLLPAGRVLSTTGGQSGAGSYVSLVFDDGRGAALIDFSIDAGDQGPCSVEANAGAANPQCVTRADGSTILTLQQKEYPAQDRGSTQWYVALHRDGMTLTFSEWNAPTSKDSALTRAEPPLTMDQAIAITENPVWSLQVPVDVATQAAGLFTPTSPPTARATS